MLYRAGWLLAAFFFSSPFIAKAQQASAGPESSQTAILTSVKPGRNCSGALGTQHGAEQSPARDVRPPAAQPDPPTPGDLPSTAIHLDEDLKILMQRQSELAQCVLATDPHESAQDLQSACSAELLTIFEMRHDGEPERDIPIGQLPGSQGFFYESGMTIDADGAPNAYNPDNSGLDDLVNAGTPGTWEGLAKNSDGEPFIQGPSDPFPGYYVSATALADRSKAVSDPMRYVDASKIPFVVLPGRLARQLRARPGDIAVAFNERNGKSSYAVFGDVGPQDRIGEGSVALAENLGIRSDARNGGARRGIFYVVFPGSGNGWPRTIEEINGDGQRLLQSWEGAALQDPCADPLQPVPAPGNRQPAN